MFVPPNIKRALVIFSCSALATSFWAIWAYLFISTAAAVVICLVGAAVAVAALRRKS